MSILLKLFLTEIIRIIGAIFCQVTISKVCNHLEVWTTWGNQKWNGAAAILIAKAIIRDRLTNEMIETEDFGNIAIAIIISMDEDKAWAIKYLIAVSVE